MERIEVLKTYKIYIGGAFPRTESGRYYKLQNTQKQTIANVCLSSRKDFRNAVVAARAAQSSWASKSAYNRSQILYRIAEMLEARKQQFVQEIMLQGDTKKEAEAEVTASIDRLIYYAGWADKYTQVFGSVNPVQSSHFNFSVHEPTGVVAIINAENHSLLQLVSTIAPAICGGNTCIVLASESKPLCAVSFAEVLHTSDLSGGVVNILTGKKQELIKHVAQHMDVNAIVFSHNNTKTELEELSTIKALASSNVKRVYDYAANWKQAETANPYMILDLQEIKTTWHPIENIGGAKAGY
jgi:acyl-CoA reductase-like NAD-dependent aldehyde dehydrogenase